MAYSKIILNGETLMDVTSDTVDAGNLLSGETATKNSGAKVTGNIASKSSSDLTASGATVTVPSGYYSAQASKSVDTMTLPQFLSSTKSGTFINGISQKDTVQYLNIPKGYNSTAQYYQITRRNNVMAGTPTATKGSVSNHSVSVTPSVTNTEGYISGGTINGTAVTVSASELVSGTYTVDSSGTKDVTNYASASISALTLPSALTNSAEGTMVATINLPNGVNKYLQIPKGYNNTNSYYQLEVPTGTAGTPTATKGTVSNHAVNVTPSVTNTTGYITGSTKTGTAVSVSASELVSGTKSITSNGTGIDVTNYASVDVSVSGGTSNVVGGTYTTGNGGSAETITLPYTGSGFPVQVTFSLAEGTDNSSGTAYNTIHQYGIVFFVVCKANATAPTYSYDDSGFVSRYIRYKNSSSVPETTGSNATMSDYYYSNYSASSSAWSSCIQINSSTALSVFVSSQSGVRGLLPNTDYYYSVVYSS